MLPKLRAIIGDLHASEIGVSVNEQHKAGRLETGSAPATINREMAALKRMFRLAVRQSLVTGSRTSPG